MRALVAADPDAVLVGEATLAEVYAAFPEARGYFSFAFVRDPVERALSCHGDKARGAGNVELGGFCGARAGHGPRRVLCVARDAVGGPMRSRTGTGCLRTRCCARRRMRRCRDFLGRFERLGDDVEAVTARLGMPCTGLAHLNRGAGVRPAPSAAALAALGRRYARDFAVFGYPAPGAGS